MVKNWLETWKAVFGMSAKEIIEGLQELKDAVDNAMGTLEVHGVEVRYGVEFVGGTVPVDVPHYSAGDAAQELKDVAENLFGSLAFDNLIFQREEADEQYLEEREAALRDLDIRE